jgi:hypothetical protein
MFQQKQKHPKSWHENKINKLSSCCSQRRFNYIALQSTTLSVHDEGYSRINKNKWLTGLFICKKVYFDDRWLYMHYDLNYDYIYYIYIFVGFISIGKFSCHDLRCCCLLLLKMNINKPVSHLFLFILE